MILSFPLGFPLPFPFSYPQFFCLHLSASSFDCVFVPLRLCVIIRACEHFLPLPLPLPPRPRPRSRPRSLRSLHFLLFKIRVHLCPPSRAKVRRRRVCD